MSNSNIFECFQRLINYIENNNVTDEESDDGEGYTDTWMSTEFSNLVNNAKTKLDELKTLTEAE